MSFSYSLAVKNARAHALTSLIDDGPTAGTITIYSGSAPASVGEVINQIALVVIPLNKPCYSSITNGVITLDAVVEQMVQVTERAGWARIANSQGVAIADMTVGVVGSDSDIELPTVDFIQGAYIKVTAGQITEA